MQPTVIEIPKFLKAEVDRRFTISSESIIIEDLSKQTITEIPLSSIAGVRYGVNWINGSHFTIGRQYVIELKDTDGDVIPIKLSSYYGIRKQTYHKAYAGITQAIWEYYTEPKVRHYLNIFDLGLPFDVNGVTINSSGVVLGKVLVDWTDLKISNYRTYFVLHHITDHTVQQSFNFLKDWDATALQSLIMTLKKKFDKATA